jgi:hypothetical protein
MKWKTIILSEIDQITGVLGNGAVLLPGLDPTIATYLKKTLQVTITDTRKLQESIVMIWRVLSLIEMRNWFKTALVDL